MKPVRRKDTIGTFLKETKRLENEKKVPQLESEVARLTEENEKLQERNQNLIEDRASIGNFIFKPGTESKDEHNASYQEAAAKTKAEIDYFEEKMISLDNSDFDSNPEKGIVDLGDGALLGGNTLYQGTYDNGEMSARKSLHFGGRYHTLDRVNVTKNKFGFDRTYRNYVGRDSHVATYDDIRGGLVNYSLGSPRFIPV